MCLCGTRGSSSLSGAAASDEEDKEMKELQRLLRHEREEEEEGGFCDTCGHRDSFAVEKGAEEDEEEAAMMAGPGRRVPRGPSGATQPAQVTSGVPLQPAVCLLLQTISEQEAPQH